MKRTVIFTLATAFFVLPCVAQKAAEPVPANPGQTTAAKPERMFVYDFNAPTAAYETVVHDALQGCPVSMEATRLGGGDMVRVGDKTMSGPGQRIRLRLRNQEAAPRIVGARVAVRGTDGKPRMSTLAESANPGGEVTKTLNLSLTDGGESWAAADLLLRGLTSVNRVSLESLTYENGTTWRRSGGSSCSIEPDPLMLISGR